MKTFGATNNVNDQVFDIKKKEAGREAVVELVKKFGANRSEYIRSSGDYSEAELRKDFLDPLLEALGWDVSNKKELPQHLREVRQEKSIEIEEEEQRLRKRPDYTLHVGTDDKLFVEAKKASIPITQAPKPAYQIRRYGWNKLMPISVLSNFDHLVIYDCTVEPLVSDSARVARVSKYDYTEYLSKYDEIYESLSRDSLYSGYFDQIFPAEKHVGAERFDRYFLEQIEKWREALASDLNSNNPGLTQGRLNFLLQMILNRIIFLRICEDRDIEKYETLKTIHTYDELKALFKKADVQYNSGLFDFIEDNLSLNVEVTGRILVDIFKELYFPESPYAFSVVDTRIIGDIYELFLGKEVHITDARSIEIIEKPEVKESQGVVSTPKFIIDVIVERTLAPLCDGKTPTELEHLRIADIACGSGNFLLAAYEFLLNYHLEWYVSNGESNPNIIYQGENNEWFLSLEQKQKILVNNIYGIDIDVQAVEVARFSLLLKVIEDENAETIKALLDQKHKKALPKLDKNIQCGNSLLDALFFNHDPDAVSNPELVDKLKPFDWVNQFPSVFEQGGFDVILGNPPYTRIQNLVKYFPEEVEYYRSESSPYIVAKSDNYDKYSLFVERSLSLLNGNGTMGYIVPHKFFTIQSGRALRKLLTDGGHVAGIVNFGIQQVFEGRSTTYTCLLFLSKQDNDKFEYEIVFDLNAWEYGRERHVETYEKSHLSEQPWEFLTANAKSLFDRLREENPITLETVADIFVGVQTSKDKIYIIKPENEDATTVTFKDINGVTRRIEKDIVRPCLLDLGLQAFSQPNYNTYIIFPYRVIEGRAQLISAEELERNYPLCWEYLIAFKEELLNRNIQNFTEETWYRYGRSQSLVKFNDEDKLIWPILSLEPRYAFDAQDTVITGGGNGPYYALRTRQDSPLSINYLLAIVSHPVIEAMVRSKASKFRGDYASHGKQFIKDLPIRDIDFNNKDQSKIYKQIDEMVNELIHLATEKEEAKTPQESNQLNRQYELIKSRIESLVEKLYRINKDDLKTLRELTEYWKGNESA